jgi:hypothetical protein
MERHVACLCSYLDNNPLDLEQEYLWPITNPVCYSETYRQRCASSQEFLSAKTVRRDEIALKIVSEWGGIRRGLAEVSIMAAEPVQVLTARGFRRVASWSKIAVLHDPEYYLIYDARVAFALNHILQTGGIVVGLFPQPASRNTKIAAALKRLAIGRYRTGSDRYLPNNEFYDAYLELLHTASLRSKLPVWQIEMALFARGPKLA